jgi:hypothetical protein
MKLQRPRHKKKLSMRLPTKVLTLITAKQLHNWLPPLHNFEQFNRFVKE